MEKTVLNERPLLGARIVSLNVRVWAIADSRYGAGQAPPDPRRPGQGRS